MSVRVGSARIDENGSTTGGEAGDQTGKEVSTQSWYLHSKGWVLLRPEEEYAEDIAQAMEDLCDNSHIGYDQDQRNTLYSAAKAKSWKISSITTDCECDCSSAVRVCLAGQIIAGIILIGIGGLGYMVTEAMVDIAGIFNVEEDAEEEPAVADASAEADAAEECPSAEDSGTAGSAEEDLPDLS